jgi:hypothetical protein
MFPGCRVSVVAQLFFHCRWPALSANAIYSSSALATGVNNTRGTGGKIFPPVMLIPVANLPPVSLILTAICHRCI